MSRTVTLKQVFDAIEINGYPQGFQHLLLTNRIDDEIVDACAIGQAGLNLGVGSIYLDDWLNELHTTTGPSVRDFIINLNDQKKQSCATIAKRCRIKFKKILDMERNLSEEDYSRLVNYQGKRV